MSDPELTNYIRENKAYHEAQEEKMDMRFARVEEKMDEKFDDIKDILVAIKTQVEKTNGRVTLLEMWRENTIGKISIISIAFGIFITIATGFILSFFKD